MSSIYERITGGMVFQTAYVTNDIDSAISKYREILGIPGFEKTRIDGITGFRYYGEQGESIHDQAIGYIGEMQIEIIQPVSGRNAYFDALVDAPAGTIRHHHLGFDCETLEEYHSAKAELTRRGAPVVQEGFFGETEFCYIDLRDSLGSYIELLWLDAPTRAGFQQMRVDADSHMHPDARLA